jgi:Holliday junction DNA helicase RuvA
MIGKLTGKIEYLGVDHVVIDVNGIGYVVYCSERTLTSLPGRGEVVSLHTDLLVKEDILQLYGFTSIVEKEWHRLLMTVQGVGAKASMAILGTLGSDGVTTAIVMEDWNSIKMAKGIGPKTAQRVVIELKDKAPSVIALGGDNISNNDVLIESSQDEIGNVVANKGTANVKAEVLSALINLGYSHTESAQAATKAMERTDRHETAIVVKLALTLLGPKL